MLLLMLKLTITIFAVGAMGTVAVWYFDDVLNRFIDPVWYAPFILAVICATLSLIVIGMIALWGAS